MDFLLRFRLRGQGRGFTLVETLVSGAVLVIAIVALFAMLEKGSALSGEDNRRRQARSIINSQMESQQYSYKNFDSLLQLPKTIITYPVINNRHGRTISSTMTINVVDSTVQTIAVKRIKITIVWPQTAPHEDSLCMVKLLSKVQ